MSEEKILFTAKYGVSKAIISNTGKVRTEMSLLFLFSRGRTLSRLKECKFHLTNVMQLRMMI